jgi:CHAT domain-containing protein
LGRLLRQESSTLGWPDYPAARAALRQAKQCAELFRGCFADPVQRKRVQAEAAHVYDLLARTCLDVWDVSCVDGRPDLEALHEAVETAEAGRARQLMDLLADEILAPNLPPGEQALAQEFADIRRRFLQAERRLREEEEAEGGVGLWPAGERGLRPGGVAGGTPLPGSRMPAFRSPAVAGQPAEVRPLRAPAEKARAEFERLQREHDQLLARIHRLDPEFNPDQPVPPVALADLQQRLPTDVPTGLVQFTVAREGGFAFIITREKVIPVRLPELTEQWAGQQALAWFQSYYTGRAGDAGRRLDAWGQAIPGLLEPLAEHVVRPVVAALVQHGLWEEAPQRPPHPPFGHPLPVGRGEGWGEGNPSHIRRLVLSPHRTLHVFPLHACRLADDQFLGDAFEVIYTPSLSLLHRCAARHRETPRRLLVAQNPTPDAPLPFTELEGASVARRFHPAVRQFRAQAAEKEALIKAGADCHVWHYSGHAFFDLLEPLQSALILGAADEAFAGGWLTLRDVFTRLRLREATLAVLNGCESGMLKPEVADDYVNLPTGFLFAGATCVLSTLWTVNDLSSALVMDKFHALWRGENGAPPLPPAAALREAVCWLREDIRSGRQLARDLLPPLLAHVPDAEVRVTCERAAAELERRFPDEPPFASPAHWAPFICSGLAYAEPTSDPRTLQD